MGAVFYQTDFVNPDVFAAKIAKQFMCAPSFVPRCCSVPICAFPHCCFASNNLRFPPLRFCNNLLWFGAMLGWFSLGGRDNAKPPVALFDLLMSPQHDSEVRAVGAAANKTPNPW